MWTRWELKTRAKANLRLYYWHALLVSFIAGLFSSSGLSSSGDSTQNIQNTVYDYGFSQETLGLILTIVVGILLAVALISLIVGLFLGGPIEVGACRFFMESREMQRSAGVGRVFWAFRSGSYLNVVKIMFLKNLYTGLWALLLVIPGIVKYYEYYMVPYILSENPDMDRREVFRLSREMMDGQKLNTLILEWSFFGWYLLGALLCFVGILFVFPYTHATMAELYAQLRTPHVYKGLRGYGGYRQEGY